jgi:hypothetical protein
MRLKYQNNSKEYYREMNALDKRIFNLEIALQANNQISNHSHTMNNVSSPKINPQELVRNSIDTSSERSLNLSSSTIDNIDPSKFLILPSVNPTSNQMKIHAYEFAAIFEDIFDELNIIHNSLSINNVNNQFHYEIEYFFHSLMLLFRTLILDSQTDFITTVNNTHNHLPSEQLLQLNKRLKESQDKISNLYFIKKNFHTEKYQQLNSTKSKLKNHLMEEKYRSKIALRYCNDWKKNHIFQWIQMLLKLEDDYTKTIHKYENILKQTEQTHHETIKILIKQNNEMKINENKFYEYYQTKTSDFERELTNFRYEFNQIKKQRQNMYEEYQRMKIIVEEYNQMKIKKQILLEKQKQQENSIKYIQTWWRGTMIRHLKQKRRRKKKT